ncbi:MAG: DUF4258 domain-containing protein [Chloroflexi bacterium]|nr:DUF4258 domain-containing protein [Chloroflexota bacterium]
MQSTDIVLSRHARMQMQRRGITLEDVALTLQFGEHVTAEEDDTMKACTELDGKPITVMYMFDVSGWARGISGHQA